MLYYTGSQYVDVGARGTLGLPRKYHVVVAGAAGSTDLIGVVLNRKGQVICEIHISKDDQGCHHFQICSRETIDCPKPAPHPE